MRTEYTFEASTSDLAALRVVVRETADLDETATVRIRTRIGADSKGSLMKVITVTEVK